MRSPTVPVPPVPISQSTISQDRSVHQARGDYEQPSSSAQRVFSITELLEQITLRLPSLTILTTAVRISRLWNKVVATSARIQQKLHFQPRSAKTAMPSGFLYCPGGTGTPIYEETLHTNIAMERMSEFGLRPSKALWGTARTQSNQIVGKHRLLFRRRNEQSLGRKLETWHTNGSWRHMLLTDPPCSVALVGVSKPKPPTGTFVQWYGRSKFSIYDPNGIKLGILDDLVQAATANIQEWSAEGSHGLDIGAEAIAHLFAEKPDVEEVL